MSLGKSSGTQTFFTGFWREGPGFHEGFLPRLFGLCSCEGGLQRESLILLVRLSRWPAVITLDVFAGFRTFSGCGRCVPVYSCYRRIFWYWTY